MDRGMRNTILSILATALIVIAGAWVQINSRISVLEVQVQSDHELYQTNRDKADKDMEQVKTMLSQIQISIARLQDMKQDKK
jgi:Tfp pilus assembly protein PilO